MIAHLRGTLISKQPSQAIVEAGGVGYEVAISVPTFTSLPNAGEQVSMHIHTHVREDALALFGFLRLEEKRLFEKLIAVSGIGPKLAMTILSGMQTQALVAAIAGNDAAQLTKIPGVGKKTAERMVLELRDKLEGILPAAQARAAAASPLHDDLLSALLNLGYQKPAAENAIEKAGKNIRPEQQGFEQMFREALNWLRK
jgi:Holliday junction DNA helicase RuvA